MGTAGGRNWSEAGVTRESACGSHRALRHVLKCAFSGCSEGCSQIIHASSLVLDSQISTPARLIFVTHRDDIAAIPARRGRQPVALVGGAGAPEGPA